MVRENCIHRGASTGRPVMAGTSAMREHPSLLPRGSGLDPSPFPARWRLGGRPGPFQGSSYPRWRTLPDPCAGDPGGEHPPPATCSSRSLGTPRPGSSSQHTPPHCRVAEATLAPAAGPRVGSSFTVLRASCGSDSRRMAWSSGLTLRASQGFSRITRGGGRSIRGAEDPNGTRRMAGGEVLVSPGGHALYIRLMTVSWRKIDVGSRASLLLTSITGHEGWDRGSGPTNVQNILS